MMSCCHACGQPIPEADGITIEASGRVTRRGLVANLSPRERQIFAALWERRPDSIPARDLISIVWGPSMMSENPLSAHLCAVRKKLKGLGIDIATVRGRVSVVVDGRPTC